MIRAGVLPLLAMLAVGCSHTTPFVAGSVEATAESPLYIDAQDVRTRLLLIGDAGLPAPDEPVLDVLARWAGELPTRSTIVFLGDNVYPRGLVEEDDPLHEITSRRLEAQLDAALESGARAIFIPGNHDWAHGGMHGLRTLRRQERAVVEVLGRGSFLPAGGCAGPAAVDLPGLRLIIFDSQRFLQRAPVAPCGSTKKGIVSEIGRLAGEAQDREVMVVAHHPLASQGPHGGFSDWRDHLFPFTNMWRWAWVPLPVIGSLYPLVRNSYGPSTQDAGHAFYAEMVDSLEEELREENPLAYAGAHDHSLQVLEGDEAFDYVLVSGGGSSPIITKVTSGTDTLFAHAAPGFMVVDVTHAGTVGLRVVEPGTGVVFSRWLRTE